METIHVYYAEILAAVGYIIWIIRLEGKVNTLEKELTICNDRINEFNGIYMKLSEIAERLSYIEGCLKRG